MLPLFSLFALTIPTGTILTTLLSAAGGYLSLSKFLASVSSGGPVASTANDIASALSSNGLGFLSGFFAAYRDGNLKALADEAKILASVLKDPSTLDAKLSQLFDDQLKAKLATVAGQAQVLAAVNQQSAVDHAAKAATVAAPTFTQSLDVLRQVLAQVSNVAASLPAQPASTVVPAGAPNAAS